MNDYIILTEDQLKGLEQKKEQYLTLDHLEYLNASKELFFKYLDSVVYSLKLDLGEGKYIGKEQEVYYGLLTVKKIKISISKMDENIRKAKQKLKDNEEKKMAG